MREDQAVGPAEASVTAAAARFAVTARTLVVVTCTALLVVGGAGRASAALIPAVLVWQVGCVAAARWPRLAAAVDCLPLAAACALLPWLNLPHGYLDLDDWARPVTSVCVGAAQFSTGLRTGTIYTFIVSAAVGLGSMMATANDWNLRAPQAIMVLWQGALARCLIVLGARSARHVDQSTAATAATCREAELSAARRDDVAEHLAALHDTVAATLTAAAQGAAGPELWQRARSDLARLKPAASFVDLLTPPETGTLQITVALAAPHGSPAIPPSAVNALLAARDEALRNVERHAGTGEARLEVRMPAPDAVELDVVDHGRGFLPSEAAQGVHLGLRLSIEERMRRSGGSARVISAPGRGTRVELRWPAA
jgi:hypothetical protein